MRWSQQMEGHFISHQRSPVLHQLPLVNTKRKVTFGQWPFWWSWGLLQDWHWLQRLIIFPALAPRFSEWTFSLQHNRYHYHCLYNFIHTRHYVLLQTQAVCQTLQYWCLVKPFLQCLVTWKVAYRKLMAFASKTDEVVSLYGAFEMPHFASFISHGVCVVGPAIQ